MKVENFYNLNQFHIYGGGKDILQSYNSTVVIIQYDTTQIITLGRDWDYSKTTSKHVYLFLEEYSKICLGITNKRQYINRLIEECNKDEHAFNDKYGYIIRYDENVR